MTHREKDMWIAEKCLGWKPGKRWGNGNGEWIFPEGETPWFRDDWDGTPSFTTKIEASLMLVEAWKGDVEMRRQNGRWKTTFFQPSEEYEAWGTTLPESICSAALKAFEARRDWQNCLMWLKRRRPRVEE